MTTKITGCKEYCIVNGREIIVAWRSPFRFTAYENGQKLRLRMTADEAHRFCDTYATMQTIS